MENFPSINTVKSLKSLKELEWQRFHEMPRALVEAGKSIKNAAANKTILKKGKS